MMGSLPPFLPFFVAAALVPALGGRVRAAVLVALPVLGAVNLYHLPDGVFWQLSFLSNALEPVRVDRLSRLFGYLFHIAALLGIVFSLHLRDRFELIASLVYAGSALGAVFAGDLITLFVFWELMAVSSVCLIWARRTGRAAGAGLRYLVVQVLSGVLLLGGAAAHLLETGTLAFTYIGLGGAAAGSSSLRSGSSAPSVPAQLAHRRLPGSDPDGDGVPLRVHHQGGGVRARARLPGTEMLVYIGAAMTCFPIFYAVIENDLRRVLAYSMINQIGFMVCGIGIGTELAVNGAVAHAFNDVIFKGLLDDVDGRGPAHDRAHQRLGSRRPLQEHADHHRAVHRGGGVDLRVSAVQRLREQVDGDERGARGRPPLGMAGAAVRLGRGVPPRRHQDPVLRVLRARFRHPHHRAAHQHAGGDGARRGLCILIGCYPRLLYDLLPFATDYTAYDATHVIAQLQILFFSALAFVWLKLTGLYPPELPSVNLDAEWVYRRVGRRAALGARSWMQALYTACGSAGARLGRNVQCRRVGVPLLRAVRETWRGLGHEPHGHRDDRRAVCVSAVDMSSAESVGPIPIHHAARCRGNVTKRSGASILGSPAVVEPRSSVSFVISWRKPRSGAGLSGLLDQARASHIIPSIPPMPPGGIAGPSSFFGFSATVASVVISNPAIDAAFCNAVRTTFVGSRIPIFTRSPYSSVCALNPKLPFPSEIRFCTTDGSPPALATIWRNGSCIARRAIEIPTFWSSFSPSSPLSLSNARTSATPPPGTTPSSTAARVECNASSTRAFFSFISTSVAAPTLITATPPASFATRS